MAGQLSILDFDPTLRKTAPRGQIEGTVISFKLSEAVAHFVLLSHSA